MKLILATKNKHKVEEFCRILSPLGWQVIPQDEVCPPDLEIEETGSTFAENAFLKAMGIYRATGLPTVADDSGLCVDALGGAPGVYSARYAGEGHNSDDNNKKLLREMEHIPDEKRTARFVCAICAVFGEGDILRCEGACEGTIARCLHGQNGFGYDPVFQPDGYACSMAELRPEEKNAISHRGNALKILKEELRNYYADK